MVYLKRVIPIFYLAAIEQAVKLLISRFCADASVVLLPKVLWFCPVQNTDLLWITNLAGIRPPVIPVVIMQCVLIVFFVLFYRYTSYIWDSRRRWIDVCMKFSIAGVLCSFIDVVFWGGSLDYIQLFNWFTFDMKDLFLTVPQVVFVLFITFSYTPYYNSLSKDERTKHTVRRWISQGMPDKMPSDDRCKLT